jgi:DNA repair photolyase
MQIRLIRTERVLSPTQINIADYVINPYRGCLFGCKYCYSSVNKNTLGREWGSFLDVKINAPEILRKELASIRPRRVLLGSTTECFQYSELKYNITKKILRVLNENGVPYTILTRSDVVEKYLDIIRENNENKIYFTLGSNNKLFKEVFTKRLYRGEDKRII